MWVSVRIAGRHEPSIASFPREDSMKYTNSMICAAAVLLSFSPPASADKLACSDKIKPKK
jgi:hypothetical protein